ncbi:Cell division protein FtsZ [Methanosarcinales archaeon]|nr:cell division protein FtsZ [Candidatus Methanoperedens sp.]CAG1006191.1 Cell division protein FtsZ [Methanosarcinales archaeon]
MTVDLRKIVKAAKPSIAVIGLGGAGCNIINWIAQKGMAGGRIIAANTDINHLATIRKADKLILLGKKLCKGYGCGGSPEMGAEATKENLPEIKAALHDATLLFLVAGMGGGTGSGAIPVVAGVARELGILTIACVTTPFKLETARREKAREAIKAITESCDSTIVIDNIKLSEVAGDLPLNDALSVANALVGDFVRNITETITQPSLVNIDFTDLRTVMEQGGICAIGIGEGDGEDRITRAVSWALEVPLLDISDISETYGLLIHIAGGEDMTLEEVAVAGERIVDKVSNTKRVIWGARVDSSLTGRVRIMAVLTGIKSTSLKASDNGITNHYLPILTVNYAK